MTDIDDPGRTWPGLFEAFTLLSRHSIAGMNPIYATDDMLTVSADPAAFSPAETERLAALGFHVRPDGTSFYSFRD